MVGATTVTLLPVVVTTVWLVPLLMLYVKVYGAFPEAPVKVTEGFNAFRQTDVVPEIVAVGNGITVTVAVPDCVREQVVVVLVTFTKL